MRLVYIAGPYRAKTRQDIRENIERARDVFADVLRAGFAGICPHTMTAGFEDLYADVSEETILETDMEALRRCDAVVLVRGWQRSAGTAAEIRVAREEGMPVYESVREMVEAEREG